jgi:hypothetical protein
MTTRTTDNEQMEIDEVKKKQILYKKKFRSLGNRR